MHGVQLVERNNYRIIRLLSIKVTSSYRQGIIVLYHELQIDVQGRPVLNQQNSHRNQLFTGESIRTPRAT